MIIKGKLLGIDHGLKRVGLAISDEEQEFVWPRPIVQLETAHVEIRNLIEQEGIVGIVIGMPFMLDGTEGEQCREVRHFIEEIKAYWVSDVFIVDERMSSKIVKALYNSDDDSLVAATMLEGFIQSRDYNRQ